MLNKHILITFLILCSSLVSHSQIEFEIIDGISDSGMKAAIEKNSTRFLQEVTDAYAQNRPLKLSHLVRGDAEMGIEMLWENVHFRPEDQYIGEIVLCTDDGYQIRNIALQLLPQDADSEIEYKEAVLNFDRAGNISSVYFSIDNNTYRSIMDKGVQLNDVQRRMEILDYVERFRTSYNQKDLQFLNQVFSDDALIITGKVISASKMADGLSISFPQVKYTKQNKQQYLSKLQRIFRNVRYVNVTFDDVTIKRHGSNPNIYGVKVVQHWKTSNYSDEGYVFMVWDFTNPHSPQIHVRTWQPMYLDSGKTRPIPEDEIFDLDSFEGI